MAEQEFVQSANAVFGVLTSSVTVAVPTIADAEIDVVAVDVSAATSFQPKVGDAVIAIPMVALPTDCILNGAYVTDTDEVSISFAAKEGGSGVTGANKAFRFLYFDCTPSSPGT
jgi:hypothetical protein